jgi:hypothetical protein
VISWIHNLPIVWLIVVVFAAMFALTAAIYFVVVTLAVGDRGRAFKAVSPGMLPPMGLVFGLLVGFLVAQLWGDTTQARDAVNNEASSLRSVVLLASAFPGAPQARMDALVRQQIQTEASREWPAMQRHSATLTVVPPALGGALKLAIALKPTSFGQQTAQREIVTSLENALDARRQRIILSQSDVNWVKWTAVVGLALLTLLAIAFVHSDNRRTAAIAMTVFAAGAAVTLVVIATQDRPFNGQFGVKPDVLLQVSPPAG